MSVLNELIFNKQRLKDSEREILLWMTNIKKEQRVSTNSLLNQLNLKSLDSLLRCNRLRRFPHVKGSKLFTGQILEVEGNRSSDRSNKSWLDASKIVEIGEND